MADPERCPKCDAVLALVGRIHNCRGPVPEVGIPTTPPRPKLSGGATVRVKHRDLTEAALLEAMAEFGTDKALSFKPRFVRPRAKKGTATYSGYRNADARRTYQRGLMKKRRAKEPV